MIIAESGFFRPVPFENETVLAYTFTVTLGWPGPLGIAAALIGCAIYGLAVERFLVSPFADRGSYAWLMASMAGGFVLVNVVLCTFGKEPRGFPWSLTDESFWIGGSGVYRLPRWLAVAAIVHTVSANYPQIREIRFLLDGHMIVSLGGYIDLEEPLRAEDFPLKRTAG